MAENNDEKEKVTELAIPENQGDRKRSFPSSEHPSDDDEEATELPPPGSNLPTPITVDGEKPRKTFYRQRAHCNPLSHNDAFDYPITPYDMDWTTDHYPNLANTMAATATTTTTASSALSNNQKIIPTVLDVGCGFGGLTLALAKLLPTEIILGLEIRAKVTEYVRLRIVAARKEATTTTTTTARHHTFQNCSVLRSNSMKYLPNYFAKGSIHKLFFCFPDPHFKRKNHGRRIISERLLSEYAYVLQPGGRLYCITDVLELHKWHVAKCNAHPMFRNITEEPFLKDDPCVDAMREETEESKKVARNKGDKYYAVYERLDDDQTVMIHAGNFF